MDRETAEYMTEILIRKRIEDQRLSTPQEGMNQMMRLLSGKNINTFLYEPQSIVGILEEKLGPGTLLGLGNFADDLLLDSAWTSPDADCIEAHRIAFEVRSQVVSGRPRTIASARLIAPAMDDMFYEEGTGHQSSDSSGYFEMRQALSFGLAIGHGVDIAGPRPAKRAITFTQNNGRFWGTVEMDDEVQWLTVELTDFWNIRLYERSERRPLVASRNAYREIPSQALSAGSLHVCDPDLLIPALRLDQRTGCCPESQEIKQAHGYGKGWAR